MQFTSPTIFLATEKLSPQAVVSFEKFLLQNSNFPVCFANDIYSEFSIIANVNKITPTKFQKEMIECLNSSFQIETYKKNNNKYIIYSKNSPIATLSYNYDFGNLHCKSIIDYDSKSIKEYKAKYLGYDNTKENFNYDMIEMFNRLFLKKKFWCQNVYHVNESFLEKILK